MQQKKYAEKLSRREKINKQNTQNIQNTTTGNMRPFRCSALRNMQASPSGRYIAGMYDGSVWLFDPYACTEEVMARDLWTASAPFATPAFGWDGDSLKVVSISNDRFITHIGPGVSKIPVRSRESAMCVAFSPDASLLFAGTMDGRVFSTKVDAPSERVHGEQRHKSIITCIAADATAPAFVTGSHDGTVKVWDSRSLALLCDVDVGAPVVKVAMRGKHVVAATVQNRVCAIDIGMTAAVSYKSCSTECYDIYVTPDCVRVIEHHFDKGVVCDIWDQYSHDHKFRIDGRRFTKDTQVVAVTDHVVFVLSNENILHANAIPFLEGPPPLESSGPTTASRRADAGAEDEDEDDNDCWRQHVSVEREDDEEEEQEDGEDGVRAVTAGVNNEQE